MSALPVDQVDIVEAEDGVTTFAYVYTAADHCLVTAFAKPEPFDADHVRARLLAHIEEITKALQAARGRLAYAEDVLDQHCDHALARGKGC